MFPLNNFRPMKSASPEEDFDWLTIQYPVLVSPKIDGIRCVTHPTLGPSSNTLKPIPNEFIRSCLSHPLLTWLDGELIVGDPNDPRGFQGTQSGVMSQGGRPLFTYLVFDCFEAGHMCGFGVRIEDAKTKIQRFRDQVKLLVDWDIQHVPHILVNNVSELLAYESEQIAKGYEGVMIRSRSGYYKKGRSTLREGGLIKMKRFTDAEAIIVDWEPLERNNNEPTQDALGLQRRGYSQSGKTVDDTRVGRFLVRGLNGRFKDTTFWIGSGLDDDERLLFRAQIRKLEQDNLTVDQMLTVLDNNPIGKTITYKYQDHGSMDAPRSPIWKGFRYDA